MKRLIFLLIASSLISCSSNYEQGINNYNSGYYELAIKKLQTIKENDENYINAQEYIELSKTKLKKRIDSINKVNQEIKHQQKQLKIQEDIKNSTAEIEAIQSIKNNDNYTEISTLLIEPKKYEIYTSKAAAYKNSENDTLRELGIQLQAELKKKQQIRFPKLRKNYYELLKETLWREDIEVTNYGTTLNFIGGTFAANKNKEDFQNLFNEQFHLLRFKKITYRWYKEEDKYTYYTLSSKKDSEL